MLFICAYTKFSTTTCWFLWFKYQQMMWDTNLCLIWICIVFFHFLLGPISALVQISLLENMRNTIHGAIFLTDVRRGITLKTITERKLETKVVGTKIEKKHNLKFDFKFQHFVWNLLWCDGKLLIKDNKISCKRVNVETLLIDVNGKQDINHIKCI